MANSAKTKVVGAAMEPHQRDLVARAAEIRGQTVSSFAKTILVREAANIVTAAEQQTNR